MADELTATETPELDSGGSEAPSSEGAGETSPEAAISGAEPVSKPFRAVAEEGKFSPEAKAAWEKLKTENPQFADAVRKALFAEDRFMRAAPGGLKEIAELRSQLEQYGGEQGLSDTFQEVDGWRQFDQLYSAGDPKVFDFLTESPEAKAAFLKLAPAAFEKYREAHPDGYNGYIAQVLSDTLDQNEVPMALNYLGWMLRENPDAMKIIQGLSGFIQSVKTLARKPVEAPKIEAPRIDREQEQLNREKTEFRRSQWGQESNQVHSGLFNREWAKQIGERKLSDTQKVTINEIYGLKLAQLIKNDPNFNRSLEQYFTADSKSGFLKYFQAFYEKAVPKALYAAILQTGLGAKPGPKPPGTAESANGTPLRPPVNGQAPVAPGFSVIGAKPAMDTVNRNATTPEMWQNRRAVLRDGRRVTWRG